MSFSSLHVTHGAGGGQREEEVKRVEGECAEYLLAKDDDASAKTVFICLKYTSLCSCKTKSILKPRGDTVIGFQGEVPEKAFRGINVPAASPAFILFPVLRWALHFDFV